jgi:ankyrin repeat protein
MFYSKTKILCCKNLSFGKLILFMNMIGETPLSYAVVNATVNTVRYLLDHGANPDKRTGDLGYTPLHLAVAQGQLPIFLFCRCLSIITSLSVSDECK